VVLALLRRGNVANAVKLMFTHAVLTQVYYELYEQLKVSVRDTGGSPDLVKRIGSKVREIDRYYSHVVDELESERFLLSRRVSELEGVAMRLSQSSPPSHDDAVGDARAQLEISRAAEKRRLPPSFQSACGTCCTLECRLVPLSQATTRPSLA
jgi:hypothetical protein